VLLAQDLRAEIVERALALTRHDRLGQRARERRPRDRSIAAAGAPEPARDAQACLHDRLRQQRKHDRGEALPAMGVEMVLDPNQREYVRALARKGIRRGGQPGMAGRERQCMRRAGREQAGIGGPVGRRRPAQQPPDRAVPDFPGTRLGEHRHVVRGLIEPGADALPPQSVDHRRDRAQIAEYIVAAAAAEEGVGAQRLRDRLLGPVERLGERAGIGPGKLGRGRHGEIDTAGLGQQGREHGADMVGNGRGIGRLVGVAGDRLERDG